MSKIVLTDLKQNEKAVISNLAMINSMVKRRLLDLDVLEGSIIKLKRTLPFGGPIAIEINGQLIGIRRQDATKINVKKVV